MSTKVLDLEITQPIPSIWELEAYNDLQILVRHHHQPLGWVYLSHNHSAGLSAEQLQQSINEQLGWEIARATLEYEMLGHLEPADQPAPPISVIVCVRYPSAQLQRCLASLLQIDYPNFEVIVVDNTSPTEKAAQWKNQWSIRYIYEENPGLGCARNRGIAEARYDIVAFIDDDMVADRLWLRAIAQAFADPEVMAVTGLSAPGQLVTDAQYLYEFFYGGMVQKMHRQKIRKDFLAIDRLAHWQPVPEKDLLHIHKQVVETNVAFRRSVFSKIGGFSHALGMDISSHYGSEVELLHRLVTQGHTLAYEPAMVVWHTTQPPMSTLWQTLYHKNCGLGAFLLTCAISGRVGWLSLGRFFVRFWLIEQIVRRLRRPGKVPRSLILFELLGMLMSPFVYVTGHFQARKVESLELHLSEADSASTQEATS
ncbi:MAG: glycosyltransferase [Scytolyngbya sp. HA4215-MV1]|nr:glycosyltransferase [Scytolyngbya sp. HA4215-MV1]